MRHDVAELVRKAEQQGWAVQQTRNNHLKWIAPVGKIVVSGSTMSDRRAIKNHLANLRRFGFRDGEVKRAE